ncbi:hypothetical protein DPQ33_15740 [Oceanidesulfovibrio indonesiensis]|uniref:Response regulatory domain-containing protein n=2 Tax=Oceanidesulfovibrio indonesiensis TaxID=54767 RepID=A0A7M3MC33_9BACT|nr:hypothetical protein DPQ33_15740 [Oceanidesulfovibrio indonesiensis]
MNTGPNVFSGSHMSRLNTHSLSSISSTTSKSSAQDDTEDGVSLRVLVADDELLNRTLLERILTKHGHEVVTAEDGGAALDMAERVKPDVLLLDLSMPTMDGMEVLAIIRSGQRDIPTDMPVIVLTGFDEKDVGAACRGFGVVDVVTKPISLDMLLTVLARVTKRGKD